MSNVAAGKDTDDEGESLNDVEKVLNKMGIALRSAKGEWRSFEDVLDEVASKWKNFDQTKQSQIATAIAGVRQQENFRALMNNYDEVGRLAGVAADSTGSASKRMETYLDSVEAKTNNLKAAWENFVMSLNQSESYKSFLDMLTNLLDKLQYVDWKSVAGVLTLFITVLGIIKATKGITTLITAIKEFKGLSSLAGIFSSKILLVVAAIAAIAVAINSINTNFDKQIADIDKRVDSINKEKEAVEEDKKSVQELYNEYQNLQSKQQLSGLDTSEKQRMAEVTKELVEQYGFEYSAVDSLNGGYVLATDALTKYMEAKEKQLKQLDEEERKSKIEKVAKQIKKQNSNIKAKGASENLTNLGFGFEQAKNELDAVGFFGSLGLEWNAYKYAFGNWGNGNFFDNYDKELQRQYKEKVGEFEDNIVEGWDEITSGIVDTLAPAIESSGLSDRFTELFTAQVKAGIKNVDTSKLETDESVEKLIKSYEKLLSQPEIKNYSNELDKKLTEFETKISDKNAHMSLQDYKDYNDALEKQASLSITLLSNMIGIDKAKDIVSKSLNQQLANSGSYFALLSDQIKKDFGEDSQVVKNFDNIAGSIININKQLADGQIDVKNYFNLIKNEIDSIDTKKLEDSFGNIGNYLATMGQIANSSGGQLQTIITNMQQGKKLNNEGVDDIKSYVGILGMVKNSTKKHMTDENGNYKIFKDTKGNDYDSRQLFEDTSGTNQSTVTNLQKQQSSLQEKINNLNAQISALNKAKNGETVPSDMNVKTSTSDNKSVYNRSVQQPSISDSNIKLASKPVQQTSKITGNDPIKGLQVSDDDILDRIAAINKGQDETANKAKAIKEINELIAQKQKELNKLKEKDTGITEDIEKEQKKVNKGMDSYLDDMEKGVSFLDRYDWDNLDKASDTLFQGFADGAFNANSTIDNVEENYKNAALSMADAFIDMTSQSNEAFTSLGENVQTQLQNISAETLKQIGLTSEATNTEIANAMLQSQSNFNAVVGAMNKNAQTALSEVLKGAGGMLEALGAAIESFTGEIKISIGGIRFNGLKTFASWDGGDLFSSDSKPVETSIKFSGSGIDTKSLGAGIKDAGTALKNNADTLAAQWTPIQPNLLNKKTNGGKTGGLNNGGGGSKKGSGSEYSAEDAASDLKDILQDIEDYEADIELDLEDQTEQLINQYNLKKNQLDALKEELDYYDSIYDVTENTTKWLDTQLKILDEESKKVAEIQNANDKIDKQRQKIYNENSKYNVQSWFDSEGNETLAYGNLLNSFEYRKNEIEKETAAAMRAEYNKVANSTDKDTISAAKDRIKQIEKDGDIKIKAIDKERDKVENIYDSVSQLNDAWKENQEAIREALQELNDKVKSIRDELIDDIMEQLERAVDKMNTSIEKDVTRLEQLKQVQESYNDILNDAIDTQQELEDELKANMDSYQYLDDTMRQLMFNEDDYKQLSGVIERIQSDIAGIWEDHYNQIQNLTEDEMYKAEYITNETERQLAAKQKEYDLAKAELDVAKAQTNLNNVKNERNTRIFANGEWQWVANPDDVKSAQQQLMEAEREKTRLEREAEQQLLIDAMDKMIDSDNLQIDKNNELLENIQDAIEKETEEVKSIEEALLNADKANLPALTTTLIGALGSDGGYMKELLGEINHSQVELAAALRGQTVQQAIDQLKSGTMSQSEFEELTKRLGFSFNPTTGMVTTQDGSFAAHYKGWVKKSNSDTQLGTAANGVQVTGGQAGSGQANAATSGGNGGGSSFPRNGRVTTSSLPLRIRSGAGTQYKILGTMPKGANVTILGEANSGWAQVRYGGITGYASRQYLHYDQGGIASGIGYMPKATLKPERVLSPRQTKAFEKLVNNITTNPVLNALSRIPSVNSKLGNLAGETNNSKNYYFSNFTVQADDIQQFINSIETIMPINNK